MTVAPTGLRSYRPGDWYAVLGGPDSGHIAVLVPPSERSRVAALWELVDGGAGADEVLDALIAGGLRSLPGFVLVADVGDRVRVVLRGPARAGIDTFDGPVALDGADATTWVERVLPGVRSVRIDVADHAEGADRPIDDGLVRVGRLDRPPYVEAADDPAPVPVPTPTPERVEPPVLEPVAALVEEPVDEEPVQEEAAVEEVVEEASFADELGDELSDEPTEAIDLSELPDLPPPPPAPPVPPLPPLAVVPPIPTVPPPPPVPGGWDPADHDGTTRTPGPGTGDDFERAQPGIPGQPQAPAVTARPVARLSFSGGELVDVDRVVLVGRAPEARRFTATDQPRLVTVSSPHQEISSTHLEIRPGSGADHGSAVVTDLGSTNGTVLVQPGLPPEVLQPGVAVQLLPGAVVDLGDGVTIRVSNP
ncbi:FHA domain-containing protein [Nocardioides lianchengensis]|uniref:FHA domain-containing protein n=1 Tax=Nocardioides lianchengensis TaxID=1045774 RepID=A0A1G6I7L1_9ACTN|nr:FHA domain-containing protein [Nocardioides lianchengensis]NYG13142.1 hypothetical protein [Nocardioides lianchengensis]SDC02418.1 FHA domain-containing protein [Nocardioides lianchengensis]